MPPGKPAVRGRSAIEAYHRQEMAGPARLSDFVLTASDTRVTGDVAYTTGTSRLTITPPGGASPVRSSGKYVVVLRRQGAAWKVAYAIYNADGPCGP
jgi:ketosteroid isomerase-like protein